jgi:hypothetical protein
MIDDPVIANIPDVPDRIAYYKYFDNGRPVFGAKKQAAELGAEVETVLRQLRSLYPNSEFEIAGRNVRFKRGEVPK